MVMEHWYNVALCQCGDAMLFWVKFRLSWEISDIETLIYHVCLAGLFLANAGRRRRPPTRRIQCCLWLRGQRKPWMNGWNLIEVDCVNVECSSSAIWAGISDLMVISASMAVAVRSMTAVSQHEKKTNVTEEMFRRVSQETRDKFWQWECGRSYHQDATKRRATRKWHMHAISFNCLRLSQSLSFTSFFQLFLLFLPLLTSHPKPPHPLFIFASTPSHLLCTMPPENLWNPLKFKCVLPLKMTLSLLFSIIEPPQPNLYMLTAVT